MAAGWHACPIVEVEWTDSFQSYGWADRADRLASHDKEPWPGQARTVGYVIRDDEHWLGLAMSLDSDDNVGSSITIPKFAITARRTLKEATGPSAQDSSHDEALRAARHSVCPPSCQLDAQFDLAWLAYRVHHTDSRGQHHEVLVDEMRSDVLTAWLKGLHQCPLSQKLRSA